jgi:iron complex outermembrane receptor protein
MRTTIAASIVLSICSATALRAQTPANLADLALEDLLKIRVQQVFGAGDRLQPVTEAPSSITIITRDEIARFGYRTLADILGGVRGFYVTNDRNYSYVGARGFNRPGDYSTRILLLVNGTRINDNVFNQAVVGPEFGIDVAMFERVEVIRGPASSLFGTNALFAIVNVVTRTGASLNGGSVEFDAGTLGTRLARGSIGRRLDNGIDFAASATYEQSDGVALLRMPAFHAADGSVGVAENLDGEEVSQAYARFSHRNLTITGVLGWRLKYVPTASFSTLFNAQEPAEQTVDERASVVAQYARTVAGAHVKAETSLESFGYKGVYPYAGGAADDPVDAFHDGFTGLRRTASGRVTRTIPGRQTVTVGGEFVDNVHQKQWGRYLYESADNFVHEQSSRQGAVYVQDEIRVRPWLIFDVGLRHDRYSHFHRTTPRGAVIVLPSANHSLKYLYGRAFRAPNAYELYYYEKTPTDLQPESIDTHEWIWEAYLGERVRTAVSTYRYKASRLVELELVDPDSILDPFAFGNAGTIEARGLEFESELRLKRGVQAVASYSLQDAKDTASDALLTNSPRHVTKLRLSVPGPLERSFASLEWRHLSTRTTLAGAAVAAASVVAASANLPITPALQLTFNVRNLFNARYADPASEEHVADALEQNGRTFRVGVSWAFWRSR